MVLVPCRKENKSIQEEVFICRLQEWPDISVAEQKPLIASIHDVEQALDFYFYIVSALSCILLFFATWISIELIINGINNCLALVHKRRPMKLESFKLLEEHDRKYIS